jgi:hypothetical protein
VTKVTVSDLTEIRELAAQMRREKRAAMAGVEADVPPTAAIS